MYYVLVSRQCSGGQCEVAPPDPFPNSEVKRFSADDSLRATVRENMSPPEHFLEINLQIAINLESNRGFLVGKKAACPDTFALATQTRSIWEQVKTVWGIFCEKIYYNNLMSKKSLGFLALVAAAIIYSTFGIWMRLLGSELGAYQTTALANIFAAIISLVIVLIQKKKIILEKGLNYRNLSLFILVVPAAIIFYNFSVMNTKVATATFALYAASFIVSFLVGKFIFKEKISKLKVIALLIAFVGLSFLSFPFSFNFGFLMGLASGVADTFANSLKKDLSGKIERMFLVLVSRVAAVVVSLVMVVGTGEKLIIFSALPLKTYLIAFLFGVLFVGVIYLTIVGFQYSDVSVGTIVLSSELFFTPIVAFLAFKEIPVSTEIIGGFLILVAMILPNLSLLKRKTSS